MYSLLRNEPLRKQFAADAKTLLTTQALTLLPALLITQLFYHWKSFLLEFGGFLVTWFVIDLVVTSVYDLWRRNRSASPTG
jgi:asparagine N-glycosylation enzyme membrane subunit Stt3